MQFLVQRWERLHRDLQQDEAYQRSEARQRLLLAALPRSAMAQIMSYARPAVPLAVAAVSPAARVYAEFAAGDESAMNLRMQVWQGRIAHELRHNSRSSRPVQPVEHVAWWLEWCALPLKVCGAAMLWQLCGAPRSLQQRLRALHLAGSDGYVALPPWVAAQLEDVAARSVEPLLADHDPAQLDHLHALHTVDCPRTTFEVIRRLPQLRTAVMGSLDSETLLMSTVAAASHLERLSVSSMRLSTIADFDRCTALTSAEFLFCADLHNLAPLAAAPRLRNVTAKESAVDDISGLGGCVALETVDFTRCRQLRTLAPLAAATWLRSITATGTAVDSVEGLGACAWLDAVDFRSCTALHSLAPLAACPRLRVIVAAHSAVNDIDGLGKCAELVCVDFTRCSGLRSLDALAESPRLRHILAKGSAVASMEGLGKCAELVSVDVSQCRGLRSLAPLAGAPRLQTVNAAESAVADIAGLGSCPALESLDVSFCLALRSLAALNGAARLERVKAPSGRPADAAALRAAPAVPRG